MDWDELWALVCTSTGWAWMVVDDLEVPQVQALQRHWTKYPPVHVSVAGLVAGLAGQSLGGAVVPRERKLATEDDLRRFAAMIGGKGSA